MAYKEIKLSVFNHFSWSPFLPRRKPKRARCIRLVVFASILATEIANSVMPKGHWYKEKRKVTHTYHARELLTCLRNSSNHLSAKRNYNIEKDQHAVQPTTVSKVRGGRAGNSRWLADLRDVALYLAGDVARTLARGLSCSRNTTLMHLIHIQSALLDIQTNSNLFSSKCI